MREKKEFTDEEIAQLMQLPKGKWPPALGNIVDVFAAYFKRKGADEEKALTDATALAGLLAHYHGGRSVYLPTGNVLRAALTHLEIARRMGREKPEDLAEEFGMSVIHIYAVSKAYNTAERAKRRMEAVSHE